MASAKSNDAASSPYQDICSYVCEEVIASPSSNTQIEDLSIGLLKSVAQINLPGAVLAVCPYLQNQFLAAAGSMVRFNLTIFLSFQFDLVRFDLTFKFVKKNMIACFIRYENSSVNELSEDNKKEIILVI